MLSVRNDKNLIVISRDELAERELKAYEQGYKDGINAATKTTRKRTSAKAVVNVNGQQTEYRATVVEK